MGLRTIGAIDFAAETERPFFASLLLEKLLVIHKITWVDSIMSRCWVGNRQGRRTTLAPKGCAGMVARGA
jgi:hypothetical protein